MLGQYHERRVLCCPLVAFDVIANDHNLLPSKAVEVMKGLDRFGRKPPSTIKGHFLCRTYGFGSPQFELG